MKFPVEKSLEEWQSLLRQKKNAQPLAYEVTRHAVTERPFTGQYNQFWERGRYHCIGCDALLFHSEDKFDADCGWPSFSRAVAGAIAEKPDHSHAMVRTEILCARCGAHLGHVFPDGPVETGLRYCLNSAAMDFASSPSQNGSQ